jgi:hypothetical protein
MQSPLTDRQQQLFDYLSQAVTHDGRAPACDRPPPSWA